MRLKRSGYSLIEVLIAFAVMSLVLAALLPGQTRLLNRSASEKHRLLALDWATSHVEALGLTAPIQAGIQNETWNDWQLELIIESVLEHEGVYVIEAQVRDSQNNVLNEFEVTRGLP